MVKEVFLDYFKKMGQVKDIRQEAKAISEYILQWREHIKYELRSLVKSENNSSEQAKLSIESMKLVVRELAHIAALFEVSVVV